MIVRRLTAGDDLLPAVKLLQCFFREEGFETPDAVIAARVRTMAGLENCGLFLAELNGGAVGVATVSLEFGIEYGWSAEMGDLYVMPSHRGRGVSRALVNATEDFLKERGAAGYQVTVTAEAEQAHGLRRFYAALGFEGEGRALLYKRLASHDEDHVG